MRLRLCQKLMIALGLVIAGAATVEAQDPATPEPDDRTVRFVQRAIAWYPDSTFKLVENTRHQTPSGSYRVVSVERICASRMLSGKPTVLVDEATDTAWLGSVGELPFQGVGAEPAAVRAFVEGVLADALSASRNLKVTKVEWDQGPRRPGAVMPLNLVIDSGYGEYRWPAGVTADGKYFVMGSEMSLSEDPVAYRRRLFADSEVVMWDTEDGAGSKVEIVEFSDLECPACKGKWPIIQMILGKFDGSVRHGMVSFPLSYHPWAFRAASASWCIAVQNPGVLIPFKEIFYGLQREMEVSLVKPTSLDFVVGRGLDEAAFRACFLKKPSIDAVHGQMSLGKVLGVNSTPTYFVNGWKIQVPDGIWFPAFVDRLLAGEEP